MKPREPAAAGRFYPNDKNELVALLEQLFLTAKPSLHFPQLRALIVPHAGYVFSGEVAATAFTQLPDGINYKRVFVIASSHCVRNYGASIYNLGSYKIPTGKVKVDLDLANQLIENHKVFNFYAEAHTDEHSLEVQLPFLRYKLGKSFKLVPIVITTNNIDEIKQIAAALAPFYSSDNLFVISSDFSHYPSSEDATRIDKLTVDAILKKDPEVFLQTIRENKKLGIANLSTSICAWTSVLALLYLSSGNSLMKFHHLQYKNSGDSKTYGDKSRVVGYHAIAVNEEAEECVFCLSETDKKYFLGLARRRLSNYLNRAFYSSSEENIPEVGKAHLGAFVSIYKGRELRGCIGRFLSGQHLYKLIEDLTVSAANDYRFDSLVADDLPEINIEISILTPLKRIFSIDEFELGRHGIYIKKGDQSGTFLPQVADKTNWTKEEFMSRCSCDKAHLGLDGWKTAELYTYEAIVFSEWELQQV